ncbi:MAG: adenylate/guanylate cyclase domain-containing protein, partial [Planctomycetota bacterium]
LRDKASGELAPVAARKRVEVPGAREAVAVSRTIVREVVANKRSILTSDAQSDDRFGGQLSIVNLSIRSLMCAPLLAAGEILGLIQVDTQTGVQAFTEADLQLLTGISAQAAIAVKNAQLYEAVETETAKRTSLQRYFSPNMVEMLMSGDLSSDLGGNAYRGTVFFSDIIGFTAMSESMPPHGVVANLNRYFTIMQKIIYDNGGNVDKFGGDAIMAFWSVPRAGAGDERLAVLTGVEMQARLWPFNLALRAEGCRSIHMGIGLNTGEFVAGNIGSEDKIEFTLIGDNVNLAARIESLAGRSHVFISESTWAPIQKEVCAIRLPPVTVKGKRDPVNALSIRAVRRRGADDWAAAIPCALATPGKEELGEGIIHGISRVGGESSILLQTETELPVGLSLSVRLLMAEYHEPLQMEATVSSSTAVHVSEKTTFFKTVLTDLRGEPGKKFLAPGSCLTTQYAWEEIHRE